MNGFRREPVKVDGEDAIELPAADWMPVPGGYLEKTK